MLSTLTHFLAITCAIISLIFPQNARAGNWPFHVPSFWPFDNLEQVQKIQAEGLHPSLQEVAHEVVAALEKDIRDSNQLRPGVYRESPATIAGEGALIALDFHNLKAAISRAESILLAASFRDPRWKQSALVRWGARATAGGETTIIAVLEAAFVGAISASVSATGVGAAIAGAGWILGAGSLPEIYKTLLRFNGGFDPVMYINISKEFAGALTSALTQMQVSPEERRAIAQVIYNTWIKHRHLKDGFQEICANALLIEGNQ